MKRWRLWIDGEEYTGECADLHFNMPALVYDVPHDDGHGQRHVLGPRGFWVALTAPSGRLLALVDGGQKVRQVKVAFGSDTLPVPVQFHQQWVERSGVRKMFGCLAANRDSEPKWVTEPGVSAGKRREEGGQ